MIHVRHNSGVIFAGRGWRGLLHRWRMWRNDRFNRELDKYNRQLERNPEEYKRHFLNNQHEIDRHFDEDAPGQDFPVEPGCMASSEAKRNGQPKQTEKRKPLRIIKNPAMLIFW